MKKNKKRSRGGAVLTVLVMLFAKKYALAFLRLLTYIAAVGGSMYLAMTGNPFGGAIVLVVMIFWFFYCGFRTNKRFETDNTLTDQETSIFSKAVDRIGLVIFVLLVVYLILTITMALVGRNIFGEMAVQGGAGNAGEYQELLQQLQGMDNAQMQQNMQEMNEALQGLEDMQQ